jgi:hypothetical protein
MSRTLQFRRLGTATLANTTGANGELIINSTNKTLTVHDGVLPGGYALLNQATDFDIDQYARNTANTATSNITILQGVNTTQNTNITTSTNLAQAAFNAANSASSGTIDQFARNSANTNSNNITIIQGVNTTQNTNITTATNLAQSAYNNSNTRFSSSGGTVTGNVLISGNLSVTNNTFISNAVEANNAIFDGTLLSGLAARSSVVLPHLVAQFASNSASYIQTNSQNINPNGSADFVVTADNGTDTDFYIDLGLHNSQSYDQILTPYDGYLTVQGSTIGQAGGNLIIGTTSSFPGLETKFVAGGYANNNVVMKLGTYGANVVGNLNVTGTINVSNVLTVTTSNPSASPSITRITTQNYNLTLQAASNTWTFVANGSLRFPDNTVQNTAYAPVTGSWTVTTGTNTYSFTLPSDGTYVMWVKGNIPNGIITWNATASVTNTNVPAIGSQYAWNYTGGGSPILLTAIPNQIKGTANTISTDNTYAGTTSNRFDFTISNTSGSAQTIYYGYTKI